jgi:uncharacterized protein (DUF1778 family)
MATGTKTERLAARVSPELKALIQQAADARGLSVTDFITDSARDAAVKTLREQEIVLSARDSLLFAEAILEPAQPSARLREAFRRHRAVLGGE